MYVGRSNQILEASNVLDNVFIKSFIVEAELSLGKIQVAAGKSTMERYNLL